MLSLDIVVFKLLLVGSFAINVQVDLLVFEKGVSLDTINAHIMLNTSLRVEFVFLSLEILPVDGDPSLAGDFEFDVSGFAHLLCAH